MFQNTIENFNVLTSVHLYMSLFNRYTERVLTKFSKFVDDMVRFGQRMQKLWGFISGSAFSQKFQAQRSLAAKLLIRFEKLGWSKNGTKLSPWRVW